MFSRQPMMDSRSVRPLRCLLAALLLLASLAGLALSYDDDKLYTFDFKGIFSTQVLDQDPPRCSGYAFRSPLLVRRVANNKLVLQLEKPHIATFNEVIEDWGAFRPFRKVQAMENFASLDRPFGVYFEEGSVDSFDTFEDEPKWVANFKRGLLAFFRLNLGEASSESVSRERTVSGDCSFNRVETGNFGPEGLYNVTKIRTEEGCSNRFSHHITPIDLNECPIDGNVTQRIDKSKMFLLFELSGARSDPVIRRAWLTDWAIHKPFGLPTQKHVIETRFSLKLRAETQDAPMMAPKNGLRTDNLYYDPPEMQNFYADVNLKDAHYMANILNARATVEQVMANLESVIEERQTYQANLKASFQLSKATEDMRANVRDRIEKSRLGQQFKRLLWLASTLNYDELEQIYREIEDRRDMWKRVYWDVLATAGTNPALAFVKKLIETGDAPYRRIRRLLTRLAFHVKVPSKKLFDEYLALCQTQKVQADKETRRTCLLTLASLIHQHCVRPHADYLHHPGASSSRFASGQEDPVCQVATAEEYFWRLMPTVASGRNALGSPSPARTGDQAAEQRSLGEKIFYAKLAGELGVKPGLDYLLKVVRARREHRFLRSAAMRGMVKGAQLYPDLIKNYVTEFFFDERERTCLRMSAFETWSSAGMSHEELMLVGRRVARDPNKQLIGYIYSYIKNSISLTLPCSGPQRYVPLSLLLQLERALVDGPSFWRQPRARVSSSWKPGSDYGLVDRITTIYKNGTGILPSEFHFESSEIISGYKLDRMAVSIRNDGLNELLLKGVLNNYNPLEMFISPPNNRARRQLSSGGKNTSELINDVHIDITISQFGRPVFSIDYDARDVRKIVAEDGSIKVNQLEKLLQSIGERSGTWTINHEFVDLSNDAMGMTIAHVSGDFDFDINLFEDIKLETKPPAPKKATQTLFALKGKSGGHKDLFTWSGVILAHSKQTVGVGFHKRETTDFPFNLSLDADLNEQKVSLRLQPTRDFLIYNYQSPVTFVSSYDPSLTDEQLQETTSWRPFYYMSGAENNTGNSVLMESFEQQEILPIGLGFKIQGNHSADQEASEALQNLVSSSSSLPSSDIMFHYSPSSKPVEMRLTTVTTGQDENPTTNLNLQVACRLPNENELNDTKSFGEREIELHTSNSGSGNPVTGNCRLALIGGTTSQRYAKAELAYSQSSDQQLNKWRLNYEHSPLNQEEAPYQFCITGDVEKAHQAAKYMLGFGDQRDEPKFENCPS